jgi:hypothetical protein
MMVAALSYAGMLAAFFVFNRPVNIAIAALTPATLPPDWQDYRMLWEVGHTLAALLAIVGLIAVGKSRLSFDSSCRRST